MKTRAPAGFTVIELLVCLIVIAVLIALAWPALTSPGLSGGPMISTLRNMRQLHMVTQQMALDESTTGKTNFGWPGDVGGSFSKWARLLVTNNYLSTNDLCKLLSAPGVNVHPNQIPDMKTSAILVYAVRRDSPDDTVFLTSANFTNSPSGGLPLVASAKPFGNKAFVVLRKGGDGAVLQAGQTGLTNIVGAFVPLCQ